MGKEGQCVYPLRFAVSCEQFFIEGYVAFGVYASSGLAWDPFDGTVDGFVLEVFIYVATVAGDSCVRCSAVYVFAKGVGGV